MTPRRRPMQYALLAAGLLMLLPFVPVFAGTGGYYGPIYSSSDNVAHAQSVLRAEHYLSPGFKSGTMDKTTIAALRDFQRDHFIPANGLLDHETMAQLETHESYAQNRQARSPRTTPSTARAASAPAASSGERQASLRTMPETASPMPLMIALGGLLLGTGLLLLRRGRA